MLELSISKNAPSDLSTKGNGRPILIDRDRIDRDHPPSISSISIVDPRILIDPRHQFDYVSSSSGLENGELLRLMSVLAKFEMGFSLVFILQGALSARNGRRWMTTIDDDRSDDPSVDLRKSEDEDEVLDVFLTLCQTIVLAGSAGLISSTIGLWSVSRYRWKCGTVASLITAILASVAALLVIIHSGIWLGKAQAIRERRSIKIMIAVILLLAVALGVCFIVSSSFVCHLWAKRNKLRRRRDRYYPWPQNMTLSPPYPHNFAYDPLSMAAAASIMTTKNSARLQLPAPLIVDPNQHNYASLMPPTGAEPMTDMEYHLCTSRCQH